MAPAGRNGLAFAAFLQAIVILGHQLVAAACPTGFTENPATGKCYLFVSQRMNYPNATAACSAYGPNVALASVFTDADSVFLINLAGQQFSWIGLYRKTGAPVCTATSVYVTFTCGIRSIVNIFSALVFGLVLFLLYMLGLQACLTLLQNTFFFNFVHSSNSDLKEKSRVKNIDGWPGAVSQFTICINVFKHRTIIFYSC
jgi:hypothetical protein